MKSKSKTQENERKFYHSGFSYFDGETSGKFYENKISLDEFEEVD